MNCADFELHLSEFIDGEMSSIIRKEFLQHKTDCPHCTEILLQFKSAVTALHTLPRRQVSPDFNQKLRARISGKAERSFWHRIEGFFSAAMIPKVAITAVAASLVAVFSYNMLANTAPKTQMQQRSFVPPPALNIEQSEPLRSPVIAERPTGNTVDMNQDAGASAVSEMVDSNQAEPIQQRSYEGQIKYVNGER